MAFRALFGLAVFAAAWLNVGLVAAATYSLPTIQLGLRNCTISAENQTDVDSWGILLGVGSAYEICAVPSIILNSTLLQSSEICSDEWLRIGNTTMTRAQCRSRRGGFVTRQALPPAPTDGLEAINPGWVSIMRTDAPVAFQYAVRAALQIRDSSMTMLEGLITQGQQHTTSHLGLGEESTLLQAAKDAGLIGVRSWGLNAGSQSLEFPRDGSLLLGGYDESSIDGPFFNYSFAKRMLKNRPCPLQVSLTEMTLRISNGGGGVTATKNFLSRANQLDVCLEPYDNLFRLPAPTLEDIKQMLAQVSAANNTPVDSQSKDLYNVEPGLVYDSAAGNFTMSMDLTIQNGLRITVPTHELVRSLRGLDARGVKIIDTRFNEVQIFGQPAAEDAPVLGKAFMSQVYIHANLETAMFHLARQNLRATVPLPKASAACPPEPSLSKTDKGLIAVGSVLAAIVVGGLAYAAYRWLLGPIGDRGSSPGADLPPAGSEPVNGPDPPPPAPGYRNRPGNSA